MTFVAYALSITQKIHKWGYILRQKTKIIAEYVQKHNMEMWTDCENI